MLIGPGIFTLTFALLVGPWRFLGRVGAPFVLAALMVAAALAVALRVTSREDDVTFPLANPAPLLSPRDEGSSAGGCS